VTRYELTTELPAVIGHGIQLREVVFNLVNNAVEAMTNTTSRSRVLGLITERFAVAMKLPCQSRTRDRELIQGN
jgi:nitrogen-specific signal transduction histidine kinase